jgi:hypothetical protein
MRKLQRRHSGRFASNDFGRHTHIDVPTKLHSLLQPATMTQALNTSSARVNLCTARFLGTRIGV